MRLYEPLAPQLAERGEIAIGQQQPVMRHAFELVDAPVFITEMTDDTALRQHVKHALLGP